MNGYVLFGSFFGSAVEFVEALTIVLAAAMVRGWRSALLGVAAGLALLALVVAAFGPLLLAYVPLQVMKLVLGTCLLLFGVRWLRKCILRYGGYKALHDEQAAFEKALSRQRQKGEPGNAKAHFAMDGFATALNGVFLEGLEAVFIVLTLGLTAHAVTSAVTGALIAVVLVCLLGLLLRRPLQFVPENTMKFVVAIMLTSFGTLWTAEGIGVQWWYKDASVLVLMLIYLVASFVLVKWLKHAALAVQNQAANHGL